jgi:hypothetical protein
MIQPDKLRLFKTDEIPSAVLEAWESHKAFVAASSFAAECIGVPFLEGVKPETLALGFFRSMLMNGGTDADAHWLLKVAVIDGKDLLLWPVAVKEYAAAALA